MRNLLYCFITLMVVWHFAHADHLDIGWKWESAPTLGQLAPSDPLQVDLNTGSVSPWKLGNYTFTALATYSITARVLHIAPYSTSVLWSDPYTHGRWADICPLDLALGWGRMSDPQTYEQISISQFERHTIWRTSSAPPIPEDEINTHLSNNHLIPADNSVRDTLFTFQRHDVVRLDGYLVNIHMPDGSTIETSLTRSDIGDGACEVIWVSHAEKIGR